MCPRRAQAGVPHSPGAALGGEGSPRPPPRQLGSHPRARPAGFVTGTERNPGPVAPTPQACPCLRTPAPGESGSRSPPPPGRVPHSLPWFPPRLPPPPEAVPGPHARPCTPRPARQHAHGPAHRQGEVPPAAAPPHFRGHLRKPALRYGPLAPLAPRALAVMAVLV